MHMNQLAHGQKNDVANQMVTRKFEQLGWDIGKRPKDHRCPDCTHIEKPNRSCKS